MTQERRRIYRDSVRIIDMRDQPPRPACLKDHFPHHPPPHPLASLYDPDGIVPLVESLRKIFPDVEKLYFGNTPSLSQYQYDAYTVTLDPAPVDDLTSTSNRPKRGAKPTPITGHIELEWTLKRSDLPMGSAHVLQPQAPDGFTLNSIAKVSTKYAQAWKWQRLARNVSALPRAISKWDSTPIMFSPTELGNIIKHIGKNKALLPDLCEFRCSIPPDWSIADLEACLARSNDAFASLTLVANRNERALAMSVNNLPRILNAVGRDTPALRKLHLHLQVRQDAVSMMNEWTISDAPDFVDSDGGTSTVDGLVGKCKPQSERTNGRDHALEVSLSIRWWRLEPLDMDDDAHRVKFTDIFQPIVKWLERNSEADSLWVEVHGIDQFNAQFRREPCGTLRGEWDFSFLLSRDSQVPIGDLTIDLSKHKVLMSCLWAWKPGFKD